jgi:hypothetical protein
MKNSNDTIGNRARYLPASRAVLQGAECQTSYKVKQFHYGPGQSHRVPGGRGYQISRQASYKCGTFVSSTHQPSLPKGHMPGTHFCYRLSQPQGHSAAGRIMSMKNSSDTIGNRNRDLPACREGCIS